MFIAITGLHAAGKSYFVNNIPVKYGFNVYNKKDIIKYVCERETDREDWAEWYKEQFNSNPYNITKEIVSYINLSENVVLDAVHSDLEWGIIKSIVKDAELIGVITPEFIRETRRDMDDKKRDRQRIAYWHNGGGCLLSDLSWTFNGGASLELNEKMFREFLEYQRKKQLHKEEQEVTFSDKKEERIQELIEEDQEIDRRLYSIEEMIMRHEKERKDFERE